MFRGTMWGREVTMQGGPLSYLVYKAEFGSDLSSDLLAAYGQEQVDVLTLLRFAWTMARTWDETVSPFEAWLDEFDPEEFSVLDAPVEVIVSAISAELFRARQTRRARIRRAAARWLGRLSQRLGA